MRAWFHSPTFHALLVVVLTLLAFAVDWTVQALNGGSLKLGPQFVVLTPLVTGILTMLAVQLRNYLEAKP